MTDFTRTSDLVRFVLRRDRLRTVLWVAGIVGLVLATAASVEGLYPTQADLDEAAASSADSAAVRALNGPAYALDTVGGQIVFQTGSFGLLVVGLMSLLTMVRNTRTEEETGRLDMVRAMPVGRHAPPAAALIVVAGMNVLVGMGVAAAMIAQGTPAAGSVIFGAQFTVHGLLFAGVAAITCQVSENGRVAGGLAGALLGVAYALRATGDAGDGTLSWFSTIGLVQKSRAYAGDVWWPLLPALVIAAVLVAVAAALASRRDLGAGLVAPRPGPPVAGRSLHGPFGLALRLQRGTLLAWAAGLFLLGASYGSISDEIDDLLAGSDAAKDVIAQVAGADLTDSFYGTSLLVLALATGGYALQATLRLRAEETADRVEQVLATPVSRGRWVASHLAVSLGGSVVVLAAGGLGLGLAAGLVVHDLGELPRLLGSALAYTPAVWVLVGGALALFGLLPRLAQAVWGVLAFCVVIGFFGPLLSLPGWVTDLSPLQHVPRVPAADLSLLPLAILAAAAVALVGLGAVGWRQRDVG